MLRILPFSSIYYLYLTFSLKTDVALCLVVFNNLSFTINLLSFFSVRQLPASVDSRKPNVTLMSDISAFAEWEGLNRNLSQEEVSQEAQRLREMMGVRDSSNDPSSDDEGSEGERNGQHGEAEVFAASPSQSREESMARSVDRNTTLMAEESSEDNRVYDGEMTEWALLDAYDPHMDILRSYDNEAMLKASFSMLFSSPQRASVEAYAKEHPIYARAHDTTAGMDEDAIEEYKRDIYIFARATGLGKHAARVEIMRATAAWEKRAGLGEGLQWGIDDDSELERFKVPRLKTAARYHQDIPASQVLQISNATASGSETMRETVPLDNSREDRKRKGMEDISKAAKIQKTKKKAKQKVKKASKLEKRRERAKQTGKTSQEPAIKTDFKIGLSHSSEMDAKDNSTRDEDGVTPTFDRVSTVSELKAIKSQPTPGPTTSAYFAKSTVAGFVIDKSIGAGMPKEGSNSSTRNKKRERKRKKMEAFKAGEPESDQSSERTFQQQRVGSDICTKGRSAAPIVKSQVTDGTEHGIVKAKRKRKRNKNRLPEDQGQNSEPKVGEQPIHPYKTLQQVQEHDGSTQLPARKRLRTHSSVQDLTNAEAPTYKFHVLSEIDQKRINNQSMEKKSKGEAGTLTAMNEESQISKRSSSRDSVELKQERAVPGERGRQLMQDLINAANDPKDYTPKNQIISTTRKQERRDRGRARSRRLNSSAGGQIEATASEKPLSKPLSELNSTNAKSLKLQRSDSEKRSSRTPDTLHLQALKAHRP